MHSILCCSQDLHMPPLRIGQSLEALTNPFSPQKIKARIVRAFWRYMCHLSFHTVRGLKNHGPSTKHELTKVCVSLPEVTSAGGSEGIEVVHNVEGVVDDEPLDGVLEVRRQHLLAVGYLFRLRVVVVLDLQLVHVKLGNSAGIVV